MSMTTELSTFDDPTPRRELLAIAGFLAGYGTSTRTGYSTDLRLFADWCREVGLSLFEVQRSHQAQPNAGFRRAGSSFWTGDTERLER